MAVVPVGIPVMQRCCISLLLALHLFAFAQSGDCQKAGGTCALDHAVPGMGGVLLQHSAKREQVLLETKIPGHRHQRAPAKSMIQTIFRGDGLPADAKKLFNEKLCKVKPAPKKTSPQLQATAKKKGGQPDNANGHEGAHDFDDPGPDNLLEDADHEQQAPKFEVADSEASHIAHGKDADAESDTEADDHVQDIDRDKKAIKLDRAEVEASHNAHENEADSEVDTKPDDNVQEDKDKIDDKDKDKDNHGDNHGDKDKGEDKGKDKEKKIEKAEDKAEKKENANENADDKKGTAAAPVSSPTAPADGGALNKRPDTAAAPEAVGK